MANNPKFKVNQLAKDLGIKPKDILDLLSGKGFEAKPQEALEPNKFDILLESLTKQNQIDNIDEYLDGITYIPSKLPRESKPAPASAPTPAPAQTTAPAVEKKEVPAQSAAPAQTQAKPEAKPEAKPVANPAAKPAQNAQAPRPAQSTQNAKPSAPQSAPKTETRPAEKTAPATAQTAPATPKVVTGQQAQRAQAQQAQANRAAQQAQQAQQSAGNRPNGTGNYANASQNRQGGNPPQNRSDRPMGNGSNNMNTQGPRPQGQGYGRPQGDRSDRPGFERRDGAQGGMGGSRPQGGFNNNPHFDRSSDKDKQDHVQGGPREKFQPQTIVRGQTPKGTTAAQKNRGATRIVDTRADSQVDLSKYDEKLDTLVPDAAKNARGGNQKLRKQPVSTRQENVRGGNQKFAKKAPVKQTLNITIPDEIVVSDLASRLKVTAGEVVKKLMMMGVMATLNQSVDFDTAALVAEEFGAQYTREVVVTIEEKLFDETNDTEEQLVPRAPVICVMGHVDHGKTSILDAIRNTHVTSGEAGGITQHIGAYRVRANGQDITFLDTPGHEAFTAMRARGAQATDIAILVVAADDGIMPQTVEAINHAKAAGIDIVVAINKMDKPAANPDAVKQELTKYDLVPEEWGGDVMCVPVSALTHQGIDDLLEAVLLVAEVKELKANPNRRAKGIVIEAKLDKGRGPVATVLVQNGTLHAGDIVIAGTAVGRVRAMTDHTGRTVKAAGPSVPVEITGLADVPQAGDEFNAVEDERMARELADQRQNKAKEEVFKKNARANLNDLFAQISEGVKDLNVIVKADVDGSAEAVKASLEKISNEEVKVRVIHSAVGGIRENDVMLAAASNAIIVGFNVRPDKAALDSAERQGVDIRTYRIIYECIEEITAAMKGMLAPKFRENLLGHAEVRQTIHVPNVGTIAGCYIQDGKITRQSEIRVVRDGIVIFNDKISSLRRFKDDVREVASGYECGVGLERFNDIKVGDILEAFIMEEIKD